MNFAPADIATAAYLYLIIGGVVTLVGGLIVYFNKKPKSRR